jgi:hypothetical protein
VIALRPNAYTAARDIERGLAKIASFSMRGKASYFGRGSYRALMEELARRNDSIRVDPAPYGGHYCAVRAKGRRLRTGRVGFDGEDLRELMTSSARCGCLRRRRRGAGEQRGERVPLRDEQFYPNCPRLLRGSQFGAFALDAADGSDLRRASSASAILAHVSQRTSKRRKPRSSSARTSYGLRSLSCFRMSCISEPPGDLGRQWSRRRALSNHFSRISVSLGDSVGLSGVFEEFVAVSVRFASRQARHFTLIQSQRRER